MKPGNTRKQTRRGRHHVVPVMTVLFLLMVWPSQSTLAQEADEVLQELRQIHEIEDRKERLAAFDELAASLFDESDAPDGQADSASDEEAKPDTGAWEFWVESDPITDEQVFFAVLEAQSGQNEFGAKPTLFLRRTGGTDEVFVTWSDYFADERVKVTHRVGSSDPVTRSWGVSTDNTATFYPGDATAFVKELAGAERLVLRTTPYDASPITAIFRVHGLREVAGEHPQLLAEWVE